MFGFRVSLLAYASIRAMGRQQTLGQSPIHSVRPMTSEPSAGKFFAMPKSTKAPPPQQSSLHEMWGKKKDPKPVASKPEPNAMAMEVDAPEEKKGECSAIG